GEGSGGAARRARRDARRPGHLAPRGLADPHPCRGQARLARFTDVTALHPSNLLEPWLLLRLAAGLVATLLFVRAARTPLRVLRHFDVARSTEGQLALERQADLSATLVRVAAVIQVGVLVLSMLAGDRLSHAIRGAMCGYGVFNASPWGFRSLGATCATA